MLDSYLTTEATKDHLLAARMATLMHEAKSENAVAFRNAVLTDLNQSKAETASAMGKRPRRPQAKALQSHCDTLDAILADLILASGHREALGYCYRSANRQAFSSSGTKATSRVYDWQMDALDGLGLVDRKKGYKAIEDFEGPIEDYRRATRIRATPALVEIAQRYGINPDNLNDHYVKRKAKLTVLLELRAEKQGRQRSRILPCPNTAKTVELKQQVERINAIYARHSFEGLPEPVVRRTFNCADSEGFDFNKGGRLYGDFQDMRREARRNILIDGQPVVELDLKASQLTILYGITKTPMPEGDPYCIDGMPRSIVKAIVTAMIGLGHTTIRRWPTESKKRLMDELGGKQPMTPKTFGKLYPIKATAAMVLKRHPVLHHLSPGRLDWADLQFIESEVLISTILELGEKYDIAALPIHDSIIVPKAEDEWAHICLGDSFKGLVGRRPIIEVKG